MARQEKILSVLVPVGWLEHYAYMLEQALAMQPLPTASAEEKAACATADKQLVARIATVKSYLSRLSVGQSGIN